MRKKIIRYSLVILVAALIIMQFFRIDKSNPTSVPAEDFLVAMAPPQDIKTLIKDACYDCHSHQTVYPWYSNVAPISWWLKDHVVDARKHLNFSIWTTYEAEKAAHKMEEAFEEVAEGEMPLKPYPLTHGEARMSDTERDKLVAWFKSAYHKLEKEKNAGATSAPANESREEDHEDQGDQEKE